MSNQKLNTHVLGRRAAGVFIDLGVFFVMELLFESIVKAHSPLRYLPATSSHAAGYYYVFTTFDRLLFGVIESLYWVLLEWLFGGTIGKLLLNIRVRSESGHRITFIQAVIRNVLRIIDFLPAFYLIGYLVARSNDKRQRLGDKLANTIVVSVSPKVII